MARSEATSVLALVRVQRGVEGAALQGSATEGASKCSTTYRTLELLAFVTLLDPVSIKPKALKAANVGPAVSAPRRQADSNRLP